MSRRKGRLPVGLCALALCALCTSWAIGAPPIERAAPPSRTCEPRPDKKDCAKTNCPVRGEQCRPTRVRCNAAGVCTVEECDCVRPNRCHVKMPGPGGPQAPSCQGTCPDGDVCTEIRTPLSDGGFELTCQCEPPPCEPMPDGSGCRDVVCDDPHDVCTPTRVVCNPNGVCRVVECDCGDPERCHPELNPPGTTPPVECVGVCPPGQICEMRRHPLPNGFVEVKCECVPEPVCEPNPQGTDCTDFVCPDGVSKCRPTQVACNPTTGECRVVACDCVEDRCHVELTAAAGPVCVGACPPGEICVRDAQMVGGLQVITCRCEPEPQVCEPNTTGTGCNDVVCPDPDQECVPTQVLCGPNGCRVIACDCQDRDRCHPEPNPVGTVPPADCVGICPPGERCVRTLTQTPAGMLLECDCEPIPQVCEPNTTGTGCNDVVCPDPDQECVPTQVLCGPNGCRVIACDCQDRDRCHPEPNPAGTTPPADCVGICPPGERCVRTLTQTPAGMLLECDCEPIPQVCEPRDDGFGCTDVACPDPTEKCVPKVVACGPDGVCKVVVCDCDDSNLCHVEMTTAAGPVCVGACPDGTECEQITTTTADGLIHIRCDCVPVQPQCEPSPNSPTGCRPVQCPLPNERCLPTHVVCQPGGPCEAVDCDCQPFDRCRAVITPNGVFCDGTCPDGTECERTTTTDPATGMTTIRCDCVPVQVQCEPLPDGSRCTDFKCEDDTQLCVPKVIECIPGTTICKVIACDCDGADRCHVEMTATGAPFCVGDCPDGTECERITTTTPIGTIQIRCDCVPVPVCEPRDDGFGCTDVVCPDPTEKCVPKVVACGPDGVCKVVVCDCDDSNRCHVEMTTAGGPVCVGVCPDGTECERTVTTDPATGVSHIRCDCVPVEPPCEPNSTSPTGCNPVVCPDPNQVCLPTKIVCSANNVCKVVSCDCRDADRCHIAPPAAGAPTTCVGDCPDGQVCVQHVTQLTPGACTLSPDPGPCDAAIPRWYYNPATEQCEMFVYGGCGGNPNNFATKEECEASCPFGGIAITCDCDPVEPVCEPDPTRTHCNDVVCPLPNEKCIPTAMAVDVDGNVYVAACDCRRADECHVVPSSIVDANPPQFDCEGGCPPGMECVEFTVMFDNGTTLTRCDCQPVQPVCEPRDDGFGCTDVVCPDPNEKCVPKVVACGPDGVCKVVVCDCDDSNLCHVEMTTAAGPVCVGACPDGTECERITTTDPATGVTTIRCDCVPVQVKCEPLPDGSRCTDFKCEDDTRLCVPKVIECIPGTTICKVIACDCDGADRCHVEMTATGAPFCSGSCPDGTECERITTTTADGLIHIRCDCVPVAVCEPNPASPTGCNPVHCPLPDERCLPTEVICIAGAPCQAVSCDCQPFDRCHAIVTPNGVFCDGACPDGTECERTVTTDPATGATHIKCDCVPVQVKCEPLPDGSRCTDFKCEDDTQLCVPKEIECIPGTTICKVIACDCDGADRCHIEMTAATGPTCVGDCPDGTECERITTTTADGLIQIRCDCVPVEPVCEPNPEGTACNDVVCPDGVSKCKPTLVQCDPLTNECQVVKCDCLDGDRCHMELTTSAGPVCIGTCPDGTECDRTVTTDPATGVITIHCDCVPVQVTCEPLPDGSRCTDFKCEDDTELCVPRVIECIPGTTICKVIACDCTGADVCHPELSTVVGGAPVACVGTCPDGFECERTLINTGTVIHVRCDCIPVQQCEPSATSVTGCSLVECPLPNQRCLPTEVFCVPGAPCEAVDCECQDVDRCHVELVNGAVPFCSGGCPTGEECRHYNVTQADGTVIFGCDCVPVQPVCEPNSTGTGCNDVVCPDPVEKCVPRSIVCDATGCRVSVCDCGDPNACHPELDPTNNGEPGTCVGTCPDGTICTPRTTTQADGTLLFTCDCVPVQPTCDPNPNSPTGCNQVTCPLPNERCLPRRAVCGPTGCVVVECDCQPFDRCHVVATPNGATCEGGCPAGEVCQRTETTNANGLIEVSCDCVPVTQECEPDDTSPTGCSDFVCPDPTERCIPVVIGVSPNGVIRVLECDCRSEDECHLTRSDADVFPPQFSCTGTCPPGERCETFQQMTTTGELITACDCVPFTPTCGPDATGLGCENVTCPNSAQRCIPTRVECSANGTNCHVVDCECRDPIFCRPVIQPAGATPPVRCEGVCPVDTVCNEVRLIDPVAGTVSVRCECQIQPPPPGLRP